MQRRITVDRITCWTVGMLLFAAAFGVSAQGYPAKPVRVIVPYAAGGPLDDFARAIAPRLAEIWGQQMLVDNRVGAGGSIGTEIAAKAPPDGYTLLLGNSGPITVNPILHKKIAYDPQRDLVPVIHLVSGQMVLSAHPSLPAKSVKELVALARANPGRINFGFIGIGNLTHLGLELLQTRAKVKLNAVPYKGAAPAMVDLIAGHIEVTFANIAGSVQYVRSGRARALAVSSAKRASVMPEIPTIAETYPGYDLITWMGIFVPASTPRPTVTKLHEDFVTVLKRPDLRERFENQGTEVIAGSAEEMAALIRKEASLYANIIKTAGIQPQ
jgi:tripartite-type tricarboxylate transporter receptor subunit TctC